MLIARKKEMGDIKALHLPGRDGGLGISGQENSVVKRYFLWKVQSGWVWVEWSACLRGSWGRWVMRAEINGRLSWNILF